jgi:hypothetical protein
MLLFCNKEKCTSEAGLMLFYFPVAADKYSFCQQTARINTFTVVAFSSFLIEQTVQHVLY